MKSIPVAALLALLAGCASAPERTDPGKVRVYESVVAAPQVATVVKRLWVESWGSAIGVPSYDTPAEAEADFREQAARLGGNGVVNFGCYRMRGDRADSPLACNGTVVRFR
jgi:heat shock protein HslJ